MKNLRKSLMVVMVAMVMALVLIPSTKAEAAEYKYTYDDGTTLKLNIVRGLATLTVNNNKPYKLSELFVVSDGWFTKYGSIYLEYYGKSMNACDYKIQGDKIKPKKVDTDVTDVNTDENKFITDYETLNGSKTAMNYDQMKAFLTEDKQDDNKQDDNKQDDNKQDDNKKDDNKQDDNKQDDNKQDDNKQDDNKQDDNKKDDNKQDDNKQDDNKQDDNKQDDNKKDDNKQQNNNLRQEGNKIIYTGANKKEYVLSSEGTVDRYVTDNLDTIYIRYPDTSIMFWSYPLQKDETTVTLHELTKQSSSLLINSEGKAVAWYDDGSLKELLTIKQIKEAINSSIDNTIPIQTKDSVKLKENAIIYTDENNKEYVLPIIGNVDKYGYDNETKTVYTRYPDGKFVCWNYLLQKNEVIIKWHEVSSKSSALVINSKGQAISWFDEKGIEQKLLTLEELDSIINPTVVTNTKKKNTGYRVVTKGNYIEFHDSDDNCVDRLKLTKKGKFNYHGVKRSNVETASFNKKGNPILVYNKKKKGKNTTISHITRKEKTIKKKGALKLSYTKKGVAKYAVRYDHSRYSVAKY